MMAATVNSSSLWSVRHLVTDRIDALESAEAELDALLQVTSRRRDELRLRLVECQNGWARVLRNVAGARPADIEESFAALASVRTELAAIEERRLSLRARMDDTVAEREMLRTVHHTVDDLVASNGARPADISGLRTASQMLFSGVEDRRRRIARDLDRGPAAAMAEVAIRASAIERLVADDAPTAAQELIDFEASVRAILDETRELVVDLQPMGPDELGLFPSLRRMVRDFGARTGIAASLHLDGDEHAVDTTRANAVYRIVQEALDNVREHAGSKSARVVLAFEPQWLRVSISDDGAGFDVIDAEAVLARSRRFGLIAMRERAEQAQGTLQVQSHVGVGTEVRAAFFAGAVRIR
jgi:two-component system sensor histidine kinase DegS